MSTALAPGTSCIPNATEVRFAVYRVKDGDEEVVNLTNTEQGAKSALTRRSKRGDFNGFREFGWYREELVGDAWHRP